MARVEKNHCVADDNYIQGLEDCYRMIKAIFEMDVASRIRYYGNTSVARILDRFDFAQIRNIYDRQKKEEIKEFKKYYIIRGIQVDKHNIKRVIAESSRLKFPPDEDMINAFLETYTDVDFASTEEIFTRE